MIFLSSPTSSIIFPVIQDADKVATFDDKPTAMYSDVEEDALFMVIANKIYEWDAGASNKTATWKSRELSYVRPYAPSVGRITADTYPVTMRLYANDIEVFNRAVTSNEAFRLPIMRKEKFWAYRVDASTPVHETLIGESMGEL